MNHYAYMQGIQMIFHLIALPNRVIDICLVVMPDTLLKAHE